MAAQNHQSDYPGIRNNEEHKVACLGLDLDTDVTTS